LQELIAVLVEDDVQERQWDMKIAIMSHTPMSEKAARGMQRELDKTYKELKRIQRSVRKPSVDMDAPVESSFKVELEPGERMDDIMGADTNKKKRR